MSNPIGMKGISFIEFSAPDEQGLASLHHLFLGLGFSHVARHPGARIEMYRQHRIVFLVNAEPDSAAAHFARRHGPCVSAMGWTVQDADRALEAAAARGAERYDGHSPYPRSRALWGIGRSLIHLVEEGDLARLFVDLERPTRMRDRGFLSVDHLTNNVERGQLERWGRFYKEIFGFTEVRFFDIRGRVTGLTSYALRSPCGTFCIPINQGSEDASQIEEYLREYRGPGIQHIALLSEDLLASLEHLEATGVETLDIDPGYYDEVFERVPNVREDRTKIRRRGVLVDGDDDGYLLQIFTRNLIGPIFFEMIQRNNHLSFGEGNFQALFRSIERDQERRGVLSSG